MNKLVPILTIGLLALSAQARSVRPPTIIFVSPGQTIQSGIDKAKPYDTVVVMPGSYAGEILIATPHLTVIGIRAGISSGVGNPIPMGSGMTAITIDADDVKLSGFTMFSWQYGIMVSGSDIYLADINTSNIFISDSDNVFLWKCNIGKLTGLSTDNLKVFYCEFYSQCLLSSCHNVIMSHCKLGFPYAVGSNGYFSHNTIVNGLEYCYPSTQFWGAE